MAANATNASSTSIQVTSADGFCFALGALPRRVRGLLLCRLLLGLRVRVADELLAPGPAERVNERRDPEDEAPRRRHQLLGDGARCGIRCAGHSLQRCD